MRRLLCALLALCALLPAAARAEAGAELLWLHGDFDSVEADGYQLVDGFYQYEKIASAGEAVLYAAGYESGSGYALLTPEEAGGELAYERMDAVSLGETEARRWRYTDAGSQWDFLAVETDGFFMSVMISVPEESAEALDADVEALIASLALEDAAQDETPMLTADFSGFTLVMDSLAGGGEGAASRTAAYAQADGGAVSVTLARGDAGEYPYTSLAEMRDVFVFAEDGEAEQLEDMEISGQSAERWRFTFSMEDGGECRADAVLLRAENYACAAIIGLTDEATAENEQTIQRLLDTLALP